MERLVPKEREFEVDLEGGRRTKTSSKQTKTKKILDRVLSGRLNYNRWDINEDDHSSSSHSLKPNNGVAVESLHLLEHKTSEGETSRPHANRLGKTQNPRKPPKPPRPPKGPTLNASDHKFVREISELATKKRARIERMKALKKLQAANNKTPSSHSSLSALIVTLLFFFIIIFQGLFSRNSASVNADGSPAPAVVAANEDFMYVEVYKNFSSHLRKQQSRF